MAGRSVLIDIIGRDQASRAFETAAANAERAAGRMGAVSARMTRTGAVMTKSVTVPLLAIAGVSVKVAVDFQKSMTLLQTAGGESAKKMAVISEGIKKVATDTGSSLKDLAAGMYVVAKAGGTKWTGAQQLNVLRVAAQGAKAENVDLATATNALTSVMMSYHIPASQAVKVQNQLVVGAGRAKTTMQEYAGALSTVIPIASSVHIKFSQVAGAIATLTQHGTTAYEATQELANTIRNLSAPSQVAQKAMQQIGLSVTDVTKNLGKRGLTGTIDLITNAIGRKLGPAGLVAVNAFKKSQSAAADATTMISKMPASLGKLSKGLDTGSVSIKDYQKAVKGMGGQAGAEGLQFLALYKSSKGFNDLLKSGSPQARTFANVLKAVMGGATGLNTALQLGGDNMTYFKKTTNDVAGAARRTGTDVLGWAKTQGTLAVQVDKAKANLQVAALEIGTLLIPAVTKIVTWVRQAADRFTHLSTSTKHWILITAGVVGALGPVLSILGRVTRAVALLVGGGKRIVGWASAVVLSSARVVAGMRASEISIEGMQTRSYAAGLRIRSAFTAIGTAAANMGRSIATVVRNPRSSLSSMWAGGGKGLTILTAIPVAAYAAGRAISSVIEKNNSLAHTVDSLAGQEGNWKQALIASNGALDNNVRLSVAASLQQNGLADKAAKAGISLSQLTYAVTHGQQAWQDLADTWRKSGKPSDDTLISLGMMQQGFQKTAGSARQLAGVQRNLGGAIHQTVSASDRLSNSLSQLDGGQLSATSASISFRQSVASLTNGVKQNGTALTGNSQKALDNRSAVIQALQAAEQHAGALQQQGKSAHFVAGALAGDVTALINTATNAGFSKTQIENLISSMHLMPKQLTTKIIADTSTAMQRFDALILKQNQLYDKTVHVNVVTTGGGGVARYRATGGTIYGAGTGTSDSVPIWASHGEEIINARQATKHRGLLKAINSGAPGFAGGGTVGYNAGLIAAALRALGIGRAGIAGVLGNARIESGLRSTAYNAREGAVNFFQYEGGRRSSLRSTASRLGVSEFSARAGVAELVKELSGPFRSVLYGLRHARSATGAAALFDSRFEISSGSARGAREAAARSFYAHMPSIAGGAAGGGSSAAAAPAKPPPIPYMFNGKGYATARAARNAALTASRSLFKLDVKIDRKDAVAFRKMLQGTVAQSRAAFDTLLADARKAGISKHASRVVIAENRRLDVAISYRNGLNRNLVKANANLSATVGKFVAEAANVKAAVTGSFDVTGAGTGFDGQQPITGSNIIAEQRQAVIRARLFVAGLVRLSKVIPGPYVRQLAEKGPSALPEVQALLGLNKGQLAQFRAGQASLAATGAHLGRFEARREYSSTIHAERALIRVIDRREDRMTRAIDRLGVKIERQLEHAVDKATHRPMTIYYNHREFARVVAESTRRAGR